MSADPMEPGIYDGLPNETYQTSAGVSVSRLKRFAEAPAKARVTREETPALRFGSLIHTAILEPEALEQRYASTTLDRRGTKAWDAAEAAAMAQGRELVKEADYDEARLIADAVHSHPIARELIVPGKLLVEQSAYWIDPETGLLCRGRADGRRPDWRAIVDLKSTEDASPAATGFSRSAAKYRYHWQDAFYRDGFEAAGGGEIEAFLFIVVEKSEPYLTAVYEIDPDDVELGRQQVRDQLRRYAECERTGIWPGYSDSIERLSLPGWARLAA